MCGYCKIPPNVKLFGAVFLHGKYDSFDTYKNKFYKVDYSQEVFTNKEINYCPMCGRNLKEDNK